MAFIPFPSIPASFFWIFFPSSTDKSSIDSDPYPQPILKLIPPISLMIAHFTSMQQPWLMSTFLDPADQITR